jgi:hypothetical protein
MAWKCLRHGEMAFSTAELFDLDIRPTDFFVVIFSGSLSRDYCLLNFMGE